MLFLVLDLAALQLHSALATQHPVRLECGKGGALRPVGASSPHSFASDGRKSLDQSLNAMGSHVSHFVEEKIGSDAL